MHSESLPRLKAPRDDGAILAYPPLEEAGLLRAANLQRLNSDTVLLQGRPLRELRDLARHEAVAAARSYLHQAGEPVAEFKSDSLFVAGHQPELFHPGVWLKNFALEALARRHGATPLNLIVDNDIAKTTMLRVPQDTHVAKVPFDRWHSETPYEERIVQDEGLFTSLPERVAPLIGAWPFRPMLNDFWAEAIRQGKRTPLLGERIAAARRSCERAWGLQPLEVPLSRLCQTAAFAWFAVHVLRELPRFHAEYNRAVQNYRQRHKLRSRLHPAPDLRQEDDWLEAPFWAWQAGAQRRRRLWAQSRGEMIFLRAGTTMWPMLGGDAHAQSSQLRQMVAAGCKIRTRALTTTMFARLLLADLFIHGIGGGKYDEVTDDILHGFFDVEPPQYLLLTGTLLLPMERYPDAGAELHRLQSHLRDLRWNPQRHVDGQSPAAADLIREKRTWIERPVETHHERAERFAHLRRLNHQLQGFTDVEEQRGRAALADAEHRLRFHQIRSSREYAFCLYPAELVRSYYQTAARLAHAGSGVP